MSTLNIPEISQVQQAIDGRQRYVSDLFLKYPQTPDNFSYGINVIADLTTANKKINDSWLAS